jgi:hypothetical protein
MPKHAERPIARDDSEIELVAERIRQRAEARRTRTAV